MWKSGNGATSRAPVGANKVLYRNYTLWISGSGSQMAKVLSFFSSQQKRETVTPQEKQYWVPSRQRVVMGWAKPSLVKISPLRIVERYFIFRIIWGLTLHGNINQNSLFRANLLISTDTIQDFTDSHFLRPVRSWLAYLVFWLAYLVFWLANVFFVGY